MDAWQYVAVTFGGDGYLVSDSVYINTTRHALWIVRSKFLECSFSTLIICCACVSRNWLVRHCLAPSQSLPCPEIIRTMVFGQQRLDMQRSCWCGPSVKVSIGKYISDRQWIASQVWFDFFTLHSTFPRVSCSVCSRTRASLCVFVYDWCFFKSRCKLLLQNS